MATTASPVSPMVTRLTGLTRPRNAVRRVVSARRTTLTKHLGKLRSLLQGNLDRTHAHRRRDGNVLKLRRDIGRVEVLVCRDAGPLGRGQPVRCENLPVDRLLSQSVALCDEREKFKPPLAGDETLRLSGSQ